MANYSGFGSGADGAGTLSGTQSPVDSTFTGTSGASSGTAGTGLSFNTNDIVLIHQSQVTNVGNYQLNQLTGYTSGTGAMTFLLPLNVTYGTGAQIIQVKQYTNVSLSGNYTVKAWNGTVGGFLVIMAQGDIDGAGFSFLANGAAATTGTGATGGGYRGGNGSGNNVNNAAGKGEGTTAGTITGGGSGTDNRGNQGSGGGGTEGSGLSGLTSNPAGGGGGGNGTAGGNGHAKSSDIYGGTGGVVGGSSDLSTMVFGGGGGGSMQDTSSIAGSSGGGCVWLICGGQLKNITVNFKGGSATTASSNLYGGAPTGGAGAGGSCLVNAVSMNSVTFQGLGGTVVGSSWPGGTGGDGRLVYNTCSATSITSDISATANIGGQPFCFIHHAIL